MISSLEPMSSVIDVACRIAANKYMSGEITKTEAFEYADKLVDEIIETDAYKQARQEVLNKFIDVKDIKFGDKVDFHVRCNQ